MESVGVTIVTGLINAVRGYLFAGLLFSAVFILFGVQRVDPDAKGRNPLFRLIIVPGLCVFWPLFVVRWVRGKQRPTERNAHRLAASSFALSDRPDSEPIVHEPG